MNKELEKLIQDFDKSVEAYSGEIARLQAVAEASNLEELWRSVFEKLNACYQACKTVEDVNSVLDVTSKKLTNNND